MSCFESCSGDSYHEYRFINPHSLHLRHTGQLFQSINSTAPVTFTATPNLRSYPNLNFRWYVNNVRQTQSNSPSFTLNAKTQAGEYTVLAIAENYSHIQATQTVRVYNDFAIPFFKNLGNQIYDNTDYAARFAIDALIDDAEGAIRLFLQGNPPLYIEWLVDGIMHTSGFASSSYSSILGFSFAPNRAGRNKIQARINGKPILYNNGGYDTEIAFRGPIQIQNLAVCLNRYPQIQITWDNREDIDFVVLIGETAAIEPSFSGTVNAGEGGIIVYSASVGGDFNIEQNKLISVSTAINTANFPYVDDIFRFGIASYDFQGVSNSALSFIRNTYLLGNHFMQTDQEIYDLLGYLIVFRPNQTRQTASADARRHFGVNQTYVSTVEIYIGHYSNYTSESLLRTIGDHIVFTGRYFFSVTRGINLVPGARLSISIEFIDQLEPNMFGRYISSHGKAEAAPFRAPQLSRTGWHGNALPIDCFPTANSVARTSDQLFFAVTNGFNPVVEPGSAAERIYNIAYDALKKIVDESMTKAQKAAAIYDYIMFLTSYDYAMLDEGMDTAEAVRHPAFYMEGVFETGFAVCDGMSKAFAMMASMLGIETVRVIGPARSGTIGEFGQHAWNKINLYGEWFIADTTWGIPSFNLTGTNFKLMSQGWFLINDFDVMGGRIEQGIGNPLSSRYNFNWFYNNGRFLHDSNCLNEQIERIVNEIITEAEDWMRGGREIFTAYAYFSTRYFVTEIQLAPPLMDVLARGAVNNSLRQQLVSALTASSVLNQNNIRIFAGNNTVVIGVR